MADGRCELCGRQVGRGALDKHHLIPRTRHSNRRNKREFTRQDVRTRLLWVCKPCHKTIHAALSEKDLEREYNTLEALRSVPEIARFVRWVRKQPPGKHVAVRRGGRGGKSGDSGLRQHRR
jgi:ribosomal protein L28